MSSYHRVRVVPGEQAKKSARSVSVNDQMVEETEVMAQTVVQQRVEVALARIKEQEKLILQDLEEKKKRMLEQGYADGKEMAVSEAYERIQAEHQEAKMQLQDMYQQLERDKREWNKQKHVEREREILRQREEICKLALVIAQKLMHKEIVSSNETLQTYFEETMKHIEGASKYIYVRMHPLTFGRLKELDYAVYHERFQIVGDPSLELSDFIVETDRTCLDYSLQAKLRKMEQWVMKVMRDVD